MIRFAIGVSLSLALLVLAASVSAADKSSEGAGGVADRGQAAKNCEVYLHDGLEALADHRQSEAERWLKQALAEAEKVGPESVEMAGVLGGLARLSLTREEYAAAESLQVRSLTLEERILGPDDVEVGRTLQDLARIKVALQKYDEAELIIRRALAIHEHGWADDESVANALDLLALIYALENKFPLAKPIFRRAVEIRVKVQGADHPDLAKSLMTMRGILTSQATLAHLEAVNQGLGLRESERPKDPCEAVFHAAEAMMVRALAIREKALGPEHPDTIDSIVRLVNCYRNHGDCHGDYGHADLLQSRLLAIREHTLGPDDPQIAETCSLLAALVIKQGKYREAEALLRRAVEIQDKLRRANPDDEAISKAQGMYDQDLRMAVRSAEVMEDPGLRPTEDDLKYLNGLKFATMEPDLASLFNSQYVCLRDDSAGDAALVHIRGLVNVERLQISGENVTDEGLAQLERLTNVKELTMIGSKVRGPGLAHLKGMTDLEKLNLGCAFLLDDDGLAHLPPLPHLKHLDLAYTQISDAGLVHLERLTALEELDVNDTKVTERGIEKLKQSRPGLKFSPPFRAETRTIPGLPSMPPPPLLPPSPFLKRR